MTINPNLCTQIDTAGLARDLVVQYLPLDRLKPHEQNARTHSRKQIRQIADSIKAFGFTNPVLLDGESGIIAGHGRVEAAKLIGMAEVPTIRLEDMSQAQKRAYLIADNKLAENAGWDPELLALELQHIIKLDAEFDLTLIGFEVAEIDVLTAPASDPVADTVPEVSPGPTVTAPGDLWRLGDHYILCGDARDTAAYARIMDGKRAQMVFTDPPYNLPIDGVVCGLGRVKHREFIMAAGEMSTAEFIAFLNTVLGRLAENSADGSIHFVCMDWRHDYELQTAARGIYTELKNICVWCKDNGGMGTFYRSKHELVFAFKHGTAPHINNFELGQNGRYRTNVWNYAGVNSLKAGRMDELKMHPTVKPISLVADAIKDCSKRQGIILDAFAGSGTTVIAAEQTSRRAYAIEIDPRYVDTTIRRWQTCTGEPAIHAESGRTFDALTEEAERSNVQ
jgi:DNA modification methylase